MSVTDQTDEARYPAFRAIMAGKKKPVAIWSLADLGLSADEVGLAAAATPVCGAAAAGAQAGTVIVDDGDGAAARRLPVAQRLL